MKKLLFLSMVFGACSFGASAQQDSTQRQRPPMGDRMRGGGYNEEMLKDLNLSEAQKADIKKSFDEQKTKMDALRGNTSLSDADKRTQMKAIRDEQQTKIKSILTPEQNTKWEAARQKMMDERKANRPPGNN